MQVYQLVSSYIIEDGYLRLRTGGGVYELFRVRFFGEASDSPKNLDSCSSCMTWDDVFDRSLKFSFFVKLGRLKLKKVDFPFINYNGKL